MVFGGSTLREHSLCLACVARWGVGYDMIDVLEEDPEIFKRLSDRRADMD
mgnify:CR=1 FL=1